MTIQQLQHLQQIQHDFEIRSREKYEMGAKEHGGNVWDQSALELVNSAMDECIDQFIYLATLKSRIKRGLP